MATGQGTTPPPPSGLSDTDSGDEEGGEGTGRSEKSVAGDGRSTGATIDNRDETMGVSLGPVAQGHIVGVSCAGVRWTIVSSLLVGLFRVHRIGLSFLV